MTVVHLPARPAVTSSPKSEPASGVRGRDALLESLDDSFAGQVLVLSSASMLIGRHPITELTVHDSSVSRVHARIYREDGVDWIEDMGSRHGTYVQGRRVDHAPLRDGDYLRLGMRVSFRYSRADAEQQSESTSKRLAVASGERPTDIACNLEEAFDLMVANGGM